MPSLIGSVVSSKSLVQRKQLLTRPSFKLKVEHCPAKKINGTFRPQCKIHCTLLSVITQFGRDPASIAGWDIFFCISRFLSFFLSFFWERGVWCVFKVYIYYNQPARLTNVYLSLWISLFSLAPQFNLSLLSLSLILSLFLSLSHFVFHFFSFVIFQLLVPVR